MLVGDGRPDILIEEASGRPVLFEAEPIKYAIRPAFVANTPLLL